MPENAGQVGVDRERPEHAQAGEHQGQQPLWALPQGVGFGVHAMGSEPGIVAGAPGSGGRRGLQARDLSLRDAASGTPSSAASASTTASSFKSRPSSFCCLRCSSRTIVRCTAWLKRLNPSDGRSCHQLRQQLGRRRRIADGMVRVALARLEAQGVHHGEDRVAMQLEPSAAAVAVPARHEGDLRGAAEAHQVELHAATQAVFDRVGQPTSFAVDHGFHAPRGPAGWHPPLRPRDARVSPRW